MMLPVQKPVKCAELPRGKMITGRARGSAAAMKSGQDATAV